MSHGSRGPPTSMDEVREAAVQRRLNNPVENVLMNSIFGAVMGAFVGYSGGALIGTIRWNSELPHSNDLPIILVFFIEASWNPWSDVFVSFCSESSSHVFIQGHSHMQCPWIPCQRSCIGVTEKGNSGVVIVKGAYYARSRIETFTTCSSTCTHLEKKLGRTASRSRFIEEKRERNRHKFG
jgi:hypothetical protein